MIIIDPIQLTRMRIEADINQRKATAALDQIPENDELQKRIEQYIILAAFGTAMAIRDDPSDEPPIPNYLIETPRPFLVPFTNNCVGWAWQDLDGAELSENMFGPDTLEVPALPVYKPKHDDHASINSLILGEEQSFLDDFEKHYQLNQKRDSLKREVNANAFIVNLVDAFQREDGARAEEGQVTGSPWPEAD
jgi:hypothetical protein